MDDVAADIQCAAVCPLHILRGIGFCESRYAVGPQQAAGGRCSRCRSRSVVDPGVCDSGDRQCRRRNCSRSSGSPDHVVISTVSIIDDVTAVHNQCAAIRPQYALRSVRFGQRSADRIGSKQATDRRGCRGRCCGVVDLGVRRGDDRQSRGSNCPGSSGRSHKVVAATVAITDGVAGDIERAAIGSQHIFRAIGFNQAGD